jgi:hypothetical protein
MGESGVDGHGMCANEWVKMAKINRAHAVEKVRPARRTNAHQNGNGEIRSNRCVEEVEDRGTGRAGGRQWLTMRHAIGPRAPTGGVARLGVVHQ